ncbi:MAG TPA: hypothetical protein VMH02_01950 [Verrucomicrobiae bacterium]|nr:hypothetical protein [Verrucomicrobiae bacterium]
MTDRELIEAARHALVNLESEQELLRNPLVPSDRSLSYGTMRFIVLSALESLGTGGVAATAQKRLRLHAILRRCDLGGEVHKSVIRSMAISRRQFYRERRESLLSLAETIAGLVAEAGPPSRAESATSATMIDLGDAAEAYIEALRCAGQYRSVWREATALARGSAGDPREIEFWLVASEAARFLADAAGAERALEAALERMLPESYWRSLWIAATAMNLQWVAGKSGAARDTFEQAVQAGPSERSLHGKEAVLLGLMLVTEARIEVDCGRWDRARSLLERATRLSRNGGTAKPSSLLRLSALILRLSAQLAYYADGDARRSATAFAAALDTAHASGELGNVASIAVHYASTLGDAQREHALRYADYGLDIARRYYPGDRFVELTLEATPLLLRTRGSKAACEAVERAHRCGLGARDRLYLDLARAKIAAHDGKLLEAADQAEEVAAQLFAHGIDAWACDARLVGAEACVGLGSRARARSKLAELGDVLECARSGIRSRARALEASLATDFFPA